MFCCYISCNQTKVLNSSCVKIKKYICCTLGGCVSLKPASVLNDVSLEATCVSKLYGYTCALSNVKFKSLILVTI